MMWWEEVLLLRPLSAPRMHVGAMVLNLDFSPASHRAIQSKLSKTIFRKTIRNLRREPRMLP